jgi:hypothetical protein
MLGLLNLGDVPEFGQVGLLKIQRAEVFQGLGHLVNFLCREDG